IGVYSPVFSILPNGDPAPGGTCGSELDARQDKSKKPPYISNESKRCKTRIKSLQLLIFGEAASRHWYE
ncbi:MAG: hypothetical protein M1511_11240, partial [Deltaproteobacteria bacterium]|nr:hypothetical protein [Deltaproteobacteria bacterium]